MPHCWHYGWAPGSPNPIAHFDHRIAGPSGHLPAATLGRALLPRCLMLGLHRSPPFSSTPSVYLPLESTLVSPCRHDAMAPGSRTLAAGPSQRLFVSYVMHSAVGARPWTCPVVSGLPSRGTSTALHAPLPPSSSRFGSAYGICPASNHPEGCYTGARSPKAPEGRGLFGWLGGG